MAEKLFRKVLDIQQRHLGSQNLEVRNFPLFEPHIPTTDWSLSLFHNFLCNSCWQAQNTAWPSIPPYRC